MGEVADCERREGKEGRPEWSHAQRGEVVSRFSRVPSATVPEGGSRSMFYPCFPTNPLSTIRK
jgi:hypothetical protein